jgi:hypothetical protein
MQLKTRNLLKEKLLLKIKDLQGQQEDLSLQNLNQYLNHQKNRKSLKN